MSDPTIPAEIAAALQDQETAMRLSACSGWRMYSNAVRELPAFSQLLAWARDHRDVAYDAIIGWMRLNCEERVDIVEWAKSAFDGERSRVVNGMARELALVSATLALVYSPDILLPKSDESDISDGVYVSLANTSWLDKALELLTSVFHARTFESLGGIEELKWRDGKRATVQMIAESKLPDGRPIAALQGPQSVRCFVCVGMWGRGDARKGHTRWDFYVVSSFAKWGLIETTEAKAKKAVADGRCSHLIFGTRDTRPIVLAGTRFSSARSVLHVAPAIDSVSLPRETGCETTEGSDPLDANDIPPFMWP